MFPDCRSRRRAGRFDLRTAVEILRREAEYRTEKPTRQGLFLFQFEVLCRHRLGYDGGLAAIADDVGVWWTVAKLDPLLAPADWHDRRCRPDLCPERLLQPTKTPHRTQWQGFGRLVRLATTGPVWRTRGPDRPRQSAKRPPDPLRLTPPPTRLSQSPHAPPRQSATRSAATTRTPAWNCSNPASASSKKSSVVGSI